VKTTKTVEWQVRPLDEYGDAMDVIVFKTYADAAAQCAKATAEYRGAVAAVVEKCVDEFDGEELIDRTFTHVLTHADGAAGTLAVKRWSGEAEIPTEPEGGAL
jgi:hypothetical protein